jgi:hypothetical protein
MGTDPVPFDACPPEALLTFLCLRTVHGVPRQAVSHCTVGTFGGVLGGDYVAEDGQNQTSSGCARTPTPHGYSTGRVLVGRAVLARDHGSCRTGGSTPFGPDTTTAALTTTDTTGSPNSHVLGNTGAVNDVLQSRRAHGRPYAFVTTDTTSSLLSRHRRVAAPSGGSARTTAAAAQSADGAWCRGSTNHAGRCASGRSSYTATAGTTT